MDFRVRTEANVGSGGCHRSIVCDCRVRRDLLAARLDAPESAEGTCLSRLVIVSNRVALPGEGAQRSGGLVTGLVDALHQAGGLWFGWEWQAKRNGTGAERFRDRGSDVRHRRSYPRGDHDGYSGFSNAALWPLFHYRLDLMNFTRRDLTAYRRVNALLADALAPLLRPSDLVWVHDYHLIPMAEELRRAGATLRIGFFLHTPFPSKRSKEKR